MGTGPFKNIGEMEKYLSSASVQLSKISLDLRMSLRLRSAQIFSWATRRRIQKEIQGTQCLAPGAFVAQTSSTLATTSPAARPFQIYRYGRGISHAPSAYPLMPLQITKLKDYAGSSPAPKIHTLVYVVLLRRRTPNTPIHHLSKGHNITSDVCPAPSKTNCNADL
jgi:hypothetical protein